MKNKLIAIGYTLFLTVSVLASPVLFEWYMTEILGREYVFENMPVGVVLLMIILFIGQLLLTIFYWMNAFNTDEK